MYTMQAWKSDIINWTKLDKPLADFFLNQAEQNLKSTLDLSDRITTRAVSILTIIIPITVLNAGFLLTQLFNHPSSSKYLVWFALAGLLALAVVLIVLAKLITVRQWMAPGGLPREIFTSHMLDNDLSNAHQYVASVMGEIERVQIKIDFNRAQNAQRLNILKWTIWFIAMAFVTLFVFIARQAAFYL
jgi:hypothetical protein